MAKDVASYVNLHRLTIMDVICVAVIVLTSNV